MQEDGTDDEGSDHNDSNFDSNDSDTNRFWDEALNHLSHNSNSPDTPGSPHTAAAISSNSNYRDTNEETASNARNETRYDVVTLSLLLPLLISIFIILEAFTRCRLTCKVCTNNKARHRAKVLDKIKARAQVIILLTSPQQPLLQTTNSINMFSRITMHLVHSTRSLFLRLAIVRVSRTSKGISSR